MLRRALLLITMAALAALPARADGWKWEPPRTTEWAVLGTVELLIAADMWRTRQILLHENGGEVQPVARYLFGGDRPSDARLYAVGALGGLATAATFYILPSPWRDIFIAGVGGAEVGVLISMSF